MRAIQNGNTFRIYDDSMKTHNALPAQCYDVCFDKNSGFFLQKHADIEVTEKVYGVHLTKVKKVLNSFKSFDRNLGVILSGDKGIGKSLFSKVLAKCGIDLGLPLIIVNGYIPGIADYLQTIEQEVIVLFDEFEKTFARHNDFDPQAEMLTLFDGIAMGKKLFVVTCNELRSLNDFLVNRPGRFHYHFRFEYPSIQEIEEYLKDKINEEYYKEIPKVVAFSRKINLNYDCLRAIAFELQCGLSFEVAIKDLNILHLSGSRYNLKMHFTNGMSVPVKNIYLDTFSDEEVTFEFCDPDTGYEVFDVTFCPDDNTFDTGLGHCIIKKDKLQYTVEQWLNDRDDKETQALYQKYKALEPAYLSLHRRMEKSLHYTV